MDKARYVVFKNVDYTLVEVKECEDLKQAVAEVIKDVGLEIYKKIDWEVSEK